MSQLAAPSRAPRTTRATSRPARTSSRPSPARRTVATRPGRAQVGAVAQRRSSSGFMALVCILAFVSAIALLLLNTMRAEQSFTLNKLRSDVTTLNDRQQGLESDISAVSTPEHLAVKAQEIGLVQAPQIVYKDRATKKTLGVASSTEAGSALNVNTLPSTPASKAAGDVLDSGTIGLHITDPVARAKAQADAKAKADQAKADQAKRDAAKKSDAAKPSASSTKGK